MRHRPVSFFLWQLCRSGVTVYTLPAARPDQLEQWLAFSNRYCGESVQRYGAIASYPTAARMGEWGRKICTIGRCMQLRDGKISPCDEICGL